MAWPHVPVHVLKEVKAKLSEPDSGCKVLRTRCGHLAASLCRGACDTSDRGGQCVGAEGPRGPGGSCSCRHQATSASVAPHAAIKTNQSCWGHANHEPNIIMLPIPSAKRAPYVIIFRITGVRGRPLLTARPQDQLNPSAAMTATFTTSTSWRWVVIDDKPRDNRKGT